MANGGSGIPAEGGAVHQLVKMLHGKKPVVPSKDGALSDLVRSIHPQADKQQPVLPSPDGPVVDLVEGLHNIPKDNKSPHIFISYSHSDKAIVHQIYQALKKKGYKVWIDIENMPNNLLEGMAQAVEASWLVLMCISKKYQDSKNCGTEAGYTFQKQKEYLIINVQPKFKPDGWLGALLGARLFYDFSGAYPFEEMIKRLTREIENVRKKVPATSRK